MNTYREDTYGEHIAGIYDEWYPEYDQAALDVLVELAQGGPVLELGIGTGRYALPLQAKGLAVHGIDASPAMVARLRAKPGGERITVTMGNFADVAVEGSYPLICILFNTFFALTTQDEQVRCLQNVARHLSPGGLFVLEGFVPDLGRYSGGQSLRTVTVGDDWVRIDAALLDPVNQVVSVQQIVLSGEGVRLYPIRLRFVWPAELDLMARLAGMRLKERWGDWNGTAFSATSARHVSVFVHA